MQRGAGEAAVGPEDDIGVEHGNERVEVTVSRGGAEPLDHLPLGGQVGIRHGRSAADAAARSAGELARRLGWALDDRGDLLERDGEHVVQDEGQSFGRGERLEHD